MKTDVAIVGAGPAGMAAAEVLVAAGVQVTIIDEQLRPGGQIYRQPPREFAVRSWLSDSIYAAGKRLLTSVSENPQIDWRLGATVQGIQCAESEQTLVLAVGCKLERVRATHTLIAPGCYDMPVPLPGSTLPGVMSVGALQVFIKSQQAIVGNAIVLSGAHPLQLVLADQLIRAGARVSAVLFAQSFGAIVRAVLDAPSAVLGGGQLSHFLAVLWRLRRAGVPIRFGRAVVEAHGEQFVHAVSVAAVAADGTIDRTSIETLECDRLGIGYGFLVSAELTRHIGAEHRWSKDGGGWICVCDSWMRTNQGGISVAGEITGVAGAQVAAEEGRLAALGILQSLARITPDEARARAEPIRKRLARLNRFAALLRSACALPWRFMQELQRDDVIVCKCEEVTCGDLDRLFAANVTMRGANATKLLSRIGMGLCQGRYCGHYVACHVSAKAGTAVPELGKFTAQFPAKPLRIGDILRRA